MIKVGSIIGLPVICIECGLKISTVKGIYIDIETKKLFAIDTMRNGKNLRNTVIVESALTSIGKDAITVKSHNCFSRISKSCSSRIISSEQLIPSKIFNTDGTFLGMISDIFFEPAALDIEALEISDGLIEDIFSGRKIVPLFGKITFGANGVFITRESQEEMINKGKGLKLMFMKGADKNERWLY